jgi:hypothetical protein
VGPAVHPGPLVSHSHRETLRQERGSRLSSPPAPETGEAAGGLPAGHLLAGEAGADGGEGQRELHHASPHP